MMNFNLNDNSLLGNGIFNGGNAGKVNNVTVSVKRRGADENPSSPAVKFVFADPSGATIDDGYFRFEVDSSRTEEENQKTARMRFGRLLSIANCLVPQGFQFPDTTGMSPTQIEDVLINTIEQQATPEKKVNIYTNYGRQNTPSKYMRVRTFDFIEHASVPEASSRLKPKADDNMTQLTPDTNPNPTSNAGGFGSAIPAAPTTGGYWGQQ